MNKTSTQPATESEVTVLTKKVKELETKVEQLEAENKRLRGQSPSFHASKTRKSIRDQQDGI